MSPMFTATLTYGKNLVSDLQESFSETRAHYRTRYLSLSGGEKVLLWILLLTIGIFVGLRIVDLGFPQRMSFDEDHFVLNARNYLLGTADINDHPPLGKLLMAAAMAVTGDDEVGWRFFPLVFGLQSIVLAYWLAKTLFSNYKAALFAAAFVAIDGFFITYSRNALLDGMLTCFVLWAALQMALIEKPIDAVFSGIFVALAASVKWSAVTMVLPLVIFTLVKLPSWKNRIVALVLSGIFTAAIPILIWMLALYLTNKGGSPSDVVAVVKRLLKHHMGRDHVTHVALSRWYTWPVLYHPIRLRDDYAWPLVTVNSTIGNPFVWLSSTIALLVAPLVAFITKPKLLPRQSVLFLLVCWVVPFFPWIFTKRDSYIYHYLPMYGFALVLLAGGLSALHKKWPIPANIVIGLALFVGCMYAPLSTHIPVTPHWAETLLYFKSWK